MWENESKSQRVAFEWKIKSRKTEFLCRRFWSKVMKKPLKWLVIQKRWPWSFLRRTFFPHSIYVWASTSQIYTQHRECVLECVCVQDDGYYEFTAYFKKCNYFDLQTKNIRKKDEKNKTFKHWLSRFYCATIYQYMAGRCGSNTRTNINYLEGFAHVFQFNCLLLMYTHKHFCLLLYALHHASFYYKVTSFSLVIHLIMMTRYSCDV